MRRARELADAEERRDVHKRLMLMHLAADQGAPLKGLTAYVRQFDRRTIEQITEWFIRFTPIRPAPSQQPGAPFSFTVVNSLRNKIHPDHGRLNPFYTLSGTSPLAPNLANSKPPKQSQVPAVKLSDLPEAAEEDERHVLQRELTKAFNAFVHNPTENNRDSLVRLANEFCDSRNKRRNRLVVSGGLPSLGKNSR